MFGFVLRRRGPIDDVDVSMAELYSLIDEGVEWCERPVRTQEDAAYALDFTDRANAVLDEAERLGLYRRRPQP